VADARQEKTIDIREGRTDEIEDGGKIGIGTTFVVAPDTLATNAHMWARGTTNLIERETRSSEIGESGSIDVCETCCASMGNCCE
jgi:hypothetical protein|tara:strand:- start:1132 stop:1386 length:255 start_codon:yes stop_codon:yes gene_type:complete